MKSKTQVLSENAEYKTLINAVVRLIGLDHVEDVNNNSISGGFNGFIYYEETSAFYKRHRKTINSMVFEMASEMGMKAIDFVNSFQCVNEDETNNIGYCLFGGKLNEDTVYVENALAWFAGETVCRMFED